MADLVPIYSAADLVQAQLLRDVLAERGIEGWIINEALSGAVGELPAGWASNPRVVVSSEDAQKARQIALAFEQGVFKGQHAQIEADTASAVVEADVWPRCLMCGERRLAHCRFCGQAGTDFPLGYFGGGEEPGGPLKVVCPTCDEPFTPRFYKHCEHCDYEFEDGVEMPRAAANVEEVRHDLSRVWLVIVAILLLFGGVTAYLGWLLG